MGFKNGAYAKIWKLEEHNGRLSARISISRKNKDTGNYEQTFSGFVKVYGDAEKVFKLCGEGGRVKLGEVDVTNKYDKERKTTTDYFLVYSAEAAETRDDFIAVPDDFPEGGLPFK